jgi:hypothetical protein
MLYRRVPNPIANRISRMAPTVVESPDTITDTG